MTDGASDDGVFPVVVVRVNGVKCRALIDSGAGGFYASASLINTNGDRPSEVKVPANRYVNGIENGARRNV